MSASGMRAAMTRQGIRGVGYCARRTRTGDWAFEYAFDLARRTETRLNIFFFPSPPCRPHFRRGRRGELVKLSDAEAIALERDTRLYYDTRLGDYLDVGFRLCEGDEEPELRRCLLIKRDYDILVLAYEGYRCTFGSGSIEDFAESMACPTVLVGPESPDQRFVNSAAELWLETLGLEHHPWHRVSDVSVHTPATDFV